MLQELPEFLPERSSETADSVRPELSEAAMTLAGAQRPQPDSSVRDIPGHERRHDTDIEIHLRFCSLTPAERDAFELLTAGLGGGDIARHLGMTDVACEFLRVKVFQKMGAVSLIDLLVMAKIYALD